MTDAAIKWKALESNPEVMTSFSRRLGLPATWAVGDIFGFDPDPLAFVPQPCLAVLLLFPSSTKTEDNGVAELAENVFYVKQPDALGNACGTIALFHAFANHMNEFGIEDGSFKKWVSDGQGKTPEQRGENLNCDAELNNLHNSSAVQGSTEVQIEGVCHHFVCFTEVNGHLYELDGRKSGPVDHGAIEASLLHTAAATIKRVYVDPNPDMLDFAMMSIAPVQ